MGDHMDDGLVRRLIEERFRAETALIEVDFRRVLGNRYDWPRAAIKRLGYEVIFQDSPHGRETYRGIRLGNEWVIDHYPEWAFHDIPFTHRTLWQRIVARLSKKGSKP